jgi:pilus assembly protein Flp/PilA
MEIMKRLVREEEGQGMVEYALVIGVISIALITVGKPVVDAVTKMFIDIAAKLVIK